MTDNNDALKTRVMVVDDERLIRELLKTFLESAGYEVMEAKGGDEAIRLASDNNPAVAMVDLFMPEIDGIEVIRRLGKVSPGTRVIAMSGGGYGGRINMLDVAERLGSVVSISKPFTRAQVLDAVADLT